MEEENKGQPQTEETFEWNQEGITKIFPIDYSIREFARLLDCDPRGISKNLIEHPILKDILYSYVAEKDGGKYCGSISKFPLPLEAGNFLKCFYKLSKSSDYHMEFYCNSKISTSTMTNFVNELCKDLCDQVMPPQVISEPDNTAFERHILFNNSDFIEAVLDDLWETQFRPRIEYIRHASYDIQVRALLDCIKTLDCFLLISELENPSEDRNDTDKSDVLQTLLRSLLSERKKGKGRNGVATYRVKNIKLDSKDKFGNTMTMKSAFNMLSNYRCPRPALLQQARQKYLSYLEKSYVPSDFEKLYLELHNHLSQTSLERSEAGWTEQLTIWMKQQCGLVLDYITTSSTTSAKLSPFQYFDILFCEMAQSSANGGISIFKDCIDLTCTFHKLSKYISEPDTKATIKIKPGLEEEAYRIGNELKKTVEKTIHDNVIMFTNYFQRAWDFLYGHDSSITNGSNCFVDIETASQTFAAKSRAAANFFNRRSLFPYSEKDVAEMFCTCKEMLESCEKNYTLERFLFFSVPMLTGVMVQILKRIVYDRVPFLVHAAQSFAEKIRQPYAEHEQAKN